MTGYGKLNLAGMAMLAWLLVRSLRGHFGAEYFTPVDLGGLAVDKQFGAGVQRPPRGVQRVALAAAVTVQVLLDPATALIPGPAGQADHVEGIHQRHRAG